MDIYLSTNKSSPECPKRISLMTSDIERKLKFGGDQLRLDTFNNITNRTITTTSDLPNLGDFMWYISDIFTMGVQYGGRVEMCNFLTNGSWYSNETMIYDYTAFSTYAAKKANLDEYDARVLSNSIVQND